MAGTTIQGLAIGAQHAASRRLKAAHPEEWDRYHEEERSARGLPRERKSYASVTEENRRLRKELDALKNNAAPRD